MSIQALPADQRPRERLFAEGASRLSDVELLALCLRTGTSRLNALELGRELMCRFGSLRALLAGRREDLARVPGVGPAKWATLLAAVEITRRSLAEEVRAGDVLSHPEAVRQFLALWLRDRPHEVFVVLFLDSQHRLIVAEEMFRGSLTQTAVYPREVARRALELNAGAVILAHNHPSGLAEASAADRLLTDQLRTSLGTLDVRVLDHLIVAGNGTLSFAQRGWL